MNKIIMLDNNNFKVDAKLIFSFTCFNKKYVVLNYKQNLFEENSKYTNLNIFEIYKIKGNKIYLSNVDEKDWNKIKDFLQEKIFHKF